MKLSKLVYALNIDNRYNSYVVQFLFIKKDLIYYGVAHQLSNFNNYPIILNSIRENNILFNKCFVYPNINYIKFSSAMLLAAAYIICK